MEIRLKFWSTGHLTLSNMSKLILHCSNWRKIVFWAWWGSNLIEMKNFKKQKSFILWLAPPVLWVSPKSKICILSYHPNISKICNISYIVWLFHILKSCLHSDFIVAWQNWKSQHEKLVLYNPKKTVANWLYHLEV